uniref:Ovule protein n=1 Tax=Mesocestoides corti TaxID=53468 RepID=A0A5K3FVS6_MESCO
MASPPIQGFPSRSMATAAQILNSPLIHTYMCLGLTSHLGLDVSAVLTHTSEVKIHLRKLTKNTTSSRPGIDG